MQSDYIFLVAHFLFYKVKKKFGKMYLSVKEREILRKRISIFKTKNPGLGKNKIVQHFSSEGYAKRTIYNALQRRNATSSFMDKKRTGRPSTL